MSKRILTLALLFVFVLSFSAVGLAEPAEPGDGAADPSVSPDPGEAVPTPTPTPAEPSETAPAEPSEPPADSAEPTAAPSETPTEAPSGEPTDVPSDEPSEDPSTPTPTPEPSESATATPTEEPTPEPTPSASPTTYTVGLGLDSSAKVFLLSSDGERDDVTDDAAIIVEDGDTLRLLVVPDAGYAVETASFLNEALTAEKADGGYVYTLRNIRQNGTFVLTLVKDTPSSDTIPVTLRQTGSGSGTATVEITPEDGDVIKKDLPTSGSTLTVDGPKDAILVISMTPAKGSAVAAVTVNGKALTWTDAGSGTYKSQPLKLTAAADMVVSFGLEVPVDVSISGGGSLSIYQNGAWQTVEAGTASLTAPEGATLTIRAKGTGGNEVASFRANGATVRASSSTKDGSLYYVKVSEGRLTLLVTFAPHTNGLDTVPKTDDAGSLTLFMLLAFLSGVTGAVFARRLTATRK